MKEHAASAVYRERVCLHLQCNYKQLQLNFITINELSLVFLMDMEFLRGRGAQVEKSWKFQGLGGVP